LPHFNSHSPTYGVFFLLALADFPRRLGPGLARIVNSSVSLERRGGGGGDRLVPTFGMTKRISAMRIEQF